MIKKRPNVVEEVKEQPMGPGEDILQEAIAVIRANSDKHGITDNSFTMIAEFWTVYLKHMATVRGWNEFQADDVAQLMVLLKIARSVYGRGKDNYIDAAGYTALASFLQPLQVDKED